MSPLTRHGLFAAYLLAIAAANASLLSAWVDYSQQDMSASHLVLIPLVGAALIVRARSRIFYAQARSSRAAGLVAASLFVIGITLDSGPTVRYGVETTSPLFRWQ